MRLIYALLVCSLFSITTFGQSGSLKGVLTDAKTKEPIIGATVVVVGSSLGAATGIDGDFHIHQIPAGSHSIKITSIGYAPKQIDNVTIESGNTTVVNSSLDEEATLLEGVTLQVTRLTNTEVSIVKDVREAKAIVSAISGMQISKTQDRDAAEVVRRIPGVTIFDGRFINVRGLNDRYNSVWLNDAASPSTETDKKSFSFDIIPTSVIDRILVYKSPSPELPGDFAGGMVKIYTRTAMPTTNWIITLSEGFRNGSTFSSMNYNTRSSTDFLGFDDGTRSIPLPNRIGSSLNEERVAAGAFKNTWGINKTSALPDLRFSMTKGSSFRILKKNIESVSLLNYSNTNTVFDIQRKDADPDVNLFDNQSTNQVRLGAMQNFGIRLTEKHKVEWRNLFNQIGTDQTTVRQGRVLAPYENSYLESYQSRYIISSQINGKHQFNEKLELTWTGGYSYTNRNDPDLKRIGYFQDPNDQKFTASIQPGSADTRYGGRFYQKLTENVYSFTPNLLKKFDVGNVRIDMNIGGYGEYKSRDFNARSLGYILPPGSSSTRTDGLGDQGLKQLPIDKIFSSQYVGFGGFAMNEITNGSDTYHAENQLGAGYLSLGIPFTSKLKLIGGLRGEYNKQSLVTKDATNKPVSANVERVNYLPSANLSYNFSQKSLIRATYGKSLNRPEFREWAPFLFYDFNFNVNVLGSLFPSVLNPAGAPLKVATIDNFDLRYELYPSAQELFHIGVFYKNFTNPIEQYILPGANRIYTFANANSAYSAGVEVDLRKNLGFIGTGFFKDINLVANASFIKSEIQINNSINQVEKRPLQGQSNYVINSGFYYENFDNGINASLTYNVFGPRIFLVGSKDYGSWGELPRNTVDFAITYPVNPKLSLTFAAQDLLNQPVQLVQDTNADGKFERDGQNDLTIQKYKRGQYFNIGIKLTL
ncbi:MAG: TonB-dependent receptor [Bacteroidetes bacterium]|nr:TonB-dependent receptor [Bacteroidota bacterium]